jgi:NADH dehydrogenase
MFKAGEMPHVVVVGGGPTGVEVAAETHEYLEQLMRAFRILKAPHALTLVHGGDRLLPQFSPDLGKDAARVLKQRGVEIVANDTVVNVEDGAVLLASGRRLTANTVIWAAGVRANPVPFIPRVEVDAKGRLAVTEALYLTGDPRVFVAGDAAFFGDTPMTAQAAVAMGRAVADNIACDIERAPMRAFSYRHKGDMFSLGQWFAGVEIGGFQFFGHFAWWLWRTVYLSKVIGFRNKVKVMVDWTLNIFLPRDMGI